MHARFAAVIGLVVAACALAFTSPAHAGEVILFDHGSNSSEQATVLAAHGVEASDATFIAGIDAASVDLTPAQTRALDADPLVASIGQDAQVHTLASPNDPLYSYQWMHPMVRSLDAWSAAGDRGNGIMVGVIDTGVDASNPDLAGKVVAGSDFVSADQDPTDEDGHGTHVAGIIAATADNDAGGVGIAPKATIYAVRALGPDGGYASDIASGIIEAVDAGSSVINLSLGATQPMPVIQAALQYALAHGAVPVCAAGNDGSSTLIWPAAYPECIAVGAVDQTGAKASFSNYGPGLDITAPGVRIYSSVLGDNFAIYSGTSMASPVVAGSIALLRAQGLDGPAARTRLLDTAWDKGAAGYDTTYGAGIVDIGAASGAVAVRTAAAPIPVTPAPAPPPATPVIPVTVDPFPVDPLPVDPFPVDPLPTIPAPDHPAPVHAADPALSGTVTLAQLRLSHTLRCGRMLKKACLYQRGHAVRLVGTLRANRANDAAEKLIIRYERRSGSRWALIYHGRLSAYAGHAWRASRMLGTGTWRIRVLGPSGITPAASYLRVS